MVVVENQKICCFTGHRPEKLSKSESEIKNELEREIKKSISEGFTTFITGMARGVDIWAGEIVIRLKDEKCNIKLICAVPYEGFEARWSAEWKMKYFGVLNRADSIEYISKNYSRNCYSIRNRWMVDRSTKVIAVFNGTKGGTKNTVCYAENKNVEIIRL